MTLDQMQAEYVALKVADVRANPECYKARVVADPEASAWSIIHGLDEADTRAMLRGFKAELRAVAKAER